MPYWKALSSYRSGIEDSEPPPQKRSRLPRAYQRVVTCHRAVRSNSPTGNTLQSSSPSASFVQDTALSYSAKAPFSSPQPPSASSASASISASSASSISSVAASFKTNSSYYDCHGILNDSSDPEARDWHYSRDVREQVRKAPSPEGDRYPSYFGNQGLDPLPLSASGPLTHTPIKNETSQPYMWGRPRAHRATYNDKDRSTVDVMYHDPTKPRSLRSRFSQFSMATYVPKRNIIEHDGDDRRVVFEEDLVRDGDV